MNTNPSQLPPGAPHFNQSGRPVFDPAVWLRLPRPGTRCPVSGLSRSTLAELVTPCARNDYRPPVPARVLRRKCASRGIVLVNRDGLLDYLNGLPAPEALRAAPEMEAAQ